MCFYIVNLLFITATMWFVRKKKNHALILGFIDLFIVASIRSMEVGRDNYSYESFFNSVSSGNVDLNNPNGFERGYIVLNQLVNNLHGDIRMLLVFVAFLSLVGVFYYVKQNSIYPWISIYYYICMYYFQQGLTIWRQAIAISIALAAYDKLENKKYVQYVFLVILAVLFHRSALLALAPFLFKIIKFTKKTIAFIAVALILAYLMRDSIVQLVFSLQIQRLSMYIDVVVSDSGYNLLIMYSLMLLFAVYSMLTYYRNVRKNLIKRDGELELRLHQGLVFGVLMEGVQLLTTYFSLLARAGLFYSVPFVLLIPNMFNCYSNKRNRKIIRYTLYGLFLIFYFYMINSWEDVYHTLWYIAD